MVVITTNEKFIIYDMDSTEFDEKVSSCTKKQIRDIALEPMNSVISNKIICFMSKEKLNDSLIDQLQIFGYNLSAVKEYYNFDGEIFTKREISDIHTIVDETDIVPAIKSNDYSLSPIIDERYRSLIELDYRLNDCTHISTVLSEDMMSEFIRFYSSMTPAESTEHSYFYEITPMSKLIVRKNNKKITANVLDNNVFVLMAPAGINDDGDITYFINEYLITSEDIQSIKNIFSGLLKKDEVKASDISEKERYMYYNIAVRQHVINVLKPLGGLGNQNNSLLSATPKTWKEYKAEFLNKYGYTVSDVNADGWLKGDIITLDARTIRNGTIVPAIIDEYETKEKRSDEIVQKDEVEITDQALLSDDSRKDIKRLFAGKNVEHPMTQLPKQDFFRVPQPLELEEDDLFGAPDSVEPVVQIQSEFSAPNEFELGEDDLFVSLEGVEQPVVQDLSLFKAPQPLELEEDDLFATPGGVEKPVAQSQSFFKAPQPLELEEDDLFATPEGVEQPVAQSQSFFKAPQPLDLEDEDLFATPGSVEQPVAQQKSVGDVLKRFVLDEEDEDLFATPEGVEPAEAQKGKQPALPPEIDLFAAPEGVEEASTEPRFIDLDVSTNKYIIDGKYTVEPGDTLSFIASRFGIGESYLRTINDLDDDKLTPGQELIIPSIVPETADIKRFDSNNGQKKFIHEESDSEEIEGDRPFLISKKKFLLSEEDLKVNEINNKINQLKRSFKHIGELNNNLNDLLSKSDDVLDDVLFQKQADIIISYEQLENKFNKIVYDYQQGFTNATDIMQRLETCESEISELEQKYTECFELAEKRQSKKKSSAKTKQDTPEIGLTETLRDRYVFDGEDFVESSGHKKM